MAFDKRINEMKRNYSPAGRPHSSRNYSPSPTSKSHLRSQIIKHGRDKSPRHSRTSIKKPNYPPISPTKTIVSGQISSSRRENAMPRIHEEVDVRRRESRSRSKENYRQRDKRYQEHIPHQKQDTRNRPYHGSQSPLAPIKVQNSSRNLRGNARQVDDISVLKREIDALRKEKMVREQEFYKTNKEMKQIKDSLRENQDFLLALKKDMVYAQSSQYVEDYGRRDHQGDKYFKR